jgi:hypothetical protein
MLHLASAMLSCCACYPETIYCCFGGFAGEVGVLDALTATPAAAQKQCSFKLIPEQGLALLTVSISLACMLAVVWHPSAAALLVAYRS